nr:hypothetical protein [Micromonospora provocatoris]
MVSESWMPAWSAPRSRVMAGNAGRYMSSDNGPIAVSVPSSTSSVTPPVEAAVRSAAGRAAVGAALLTSGYPLDRCVRGTLHL